MSLRLSQLFTTNTTSIEGLHLTGLGLSFRLRPMAWLGVEPGLDLYRGYDGYEALHTETNVSTDLLLYLNPRSAVQFFGVLGASVGFARHSENWAHSETNNLGARLGIGLEFRVTHLVSFNVNAVGFSRGLTGKKQREGAADDAALVPETQRGGMLQAGASLYF